MRLPALGGLLLLAACEPNVTAPVNVMALVPSLSNNLETRQVQLTTLTPPASLVHMTGPVLTLTGGAQVEINPNDPALSAITTEDQLRDVWLKNKGGSVRANFVDRAGVQWPADFHSWAMTTTYYNFEQAFLYYQKIYDGRPTDELKGVEVFYFGGFKDLSSGSDVEARDNALFFPPVRAFLVLPFEKLQKVPLSLNLGIIGHEFAHLVFNKRVFAGSSLPKPLTQWTLTPFNVLKAMDEGFADFHGYGVTCTSAGKGPGCLTSFLSASFDAKKADEKKVIDERDMANPKQCMTAELRAAIHNFQPAEFLNAGLHYKLGTLISTALFQASFPSGKVELVQKALIAALDDDSAATPGFRQSVNLFLQTPAKFTPELMANTIAAHVSDLDLRKQVCKQLSDRLQVECAVFPCASMPACDTATRGTSCPTLPPE